MDTLALIGSSMGLGFLAGIRLYATVFALGLAIRFGWYHPDAGAAGLLVLAHPAVLTASGIACLIEFVADKVPWVDSAWDSIHTFIRPIGAVLLASAAIGNFDPSPQSHPHAAQRQRRPGQHRFQSFHTPGRQSQP
jgi:hypothetical protein